MKFYCPAVLVLAASSLPGVASAQAPNTGRFGPLIAVDHVPIAVRSLERAERTYERLGFRLKPGRLHANGLRNTFVKFSEGNYLELITPEAGVTDELSAKYVEQLGDTEGGTFLAFRVDSLQSIARELESAGAEMRVELHRGAFATLAFEHPPLQSFFLIEYLAPVVDPPELFDHPNSAVGIDAVWLSRTHYAALRSVASLGRVGGVAEAAGDPGGAPIVGVTIRVRSVEVARRAIRYGAGLDLPIRADSRGAVLLVPAEHAHGVWLELLEPVFLEWNP